MCGGTFNRGILCPNRSWDVYWAYIRGEGDAGSLQLVGGLFANEIWGGGGGGAYIREGGFLSGDFTARVFGVKRSKHIYLKCRWLFVTKKEKSNFFTFQV